MCVVLAVFHCKLMSIYNGKSEFAMESDAHFHLKSIDIEFQNQYFIIKYFFLTPYSYLVCRKNREMNLVGIVLKIFHNDKKYLAKHSDLVGIYLESEASPPNDSKRLCNQEQPNSPWS